MQRFVPVTLFVAGVYVFLFWLQDFGFQQNSQIASLAFLPHGWRIISFFLFRFQGIPGLLLGHVATNALFFDNFATDPMIGITTSMASVAILPLAYVLIRKLGRDLLATRPEYPVVPFTNLLALGAIATLLNGVAVQSVISLLTGNPVRWDLVQLYMTGDLVGMLLFVGALIAFFRFQRRAALAS